MFLKKFLKLIQNLTDFSLFLLCLFFRPHVLIGKGHAGQIFVGIQRGFEVVVIVGNGSAGVVIRYTFGIEVDLHQCSLTLH